MTDNGRRLAAVLFEGLEELERLVRAGDLATYRRHAPRWERLMHEAEERLGGVTE